MKANRPSSPTPTRLQKLIARAWNVAYWAKYYWQVALTRHGGFATTGLVVVLVSISIAFEPRLQALVAPYYQTESSVQNLRSLLQALGGALIAVSGIAFTLVMFAVQTNSERMPHGLFRRLGSDWRLLVAFWTTLCLSFTVALLSVFQRVDWIAWISLWAFWASISTVTLFLYAYRRALTLINPTEQLSILVKQTTREMRAWRNRAERARPLYHFNDTDVPNTTHDWPLYAYFAKQSTWAASVQKAMEYAFAYARRAADNTEYEVVSTALNAVTVLAQSYIAAKGKTFFHRPPMLDNPMSDDLFITQTLDRYRVAIDIAIERRDEQELMLLLKGLSTLCILFIRIDYSAEHANKTHGHLAIAHLAGAADSLLAKGLTDRLMQGVKLLGESAVALIALEGPDAAQSVVKKLAEIGYASLANQNLRAVTYTVMGQLGTICALLLARTAGTTGFALKQVLDAAGTVGSVCLELSDNALDRAHSFYLEPFFGHASDGFADKLEAVANAIVSAKPGDKQAEALADNVEEFGERVPTAIAPLLSKAIAKRSSLVVDLVFWMIHVAGALQGVAASDVCREYSREELVKHIGHLLWVLNRAPNSQSDLEMLASIQIEDQFFSLAYDAEDRGLTEAHETYSQCMLGWGLRASRLDPREDSLSQSLMGVALLTTITEQPAFSFAAFKGLLTQSLEGTSSLSQEARDYTARRMRKRVGNLNSERAGLNRIDNALASVDRSTIEPMILELAEIVSPKPKPVNQDSGG